MRIAEKTRNTKETEISAKLNLDGKGEYKIETPNAFFTHMLEQLACHSGFDIELCVKSLDNNKHHFVEDCAIVLGSLIKEALGDKTGIKRYSDITLPMDDALITVALDISNRAYFKTDLNIKEECTEDFETVLFYHFLNTFSMNLGLCLHVRQLDGFDPHHIIEAAFKALAHALADACKITNDKIPSSKGLL